MLTLPDFKEKKIVFISHFGDEPQEVKFGNSNIKLYKDEQCVHQISCYLVLSLFIIGHTTLTSELIRKAKEFGISIFLLTNSFETYAEIVSQAEGNYKLREVQYTVSKERVLEIAKYLVKNKIENQRTVLKQYKKPIPEYNAEQNITQVNKIDELLGIEGSFASQYFKLLFNDIGWQRRAPRTKEDIPNLLLDIGYTFLFNYVDSLLRLFGFDTYKGFYHQLFFQRKSLSCDIMEPMRPLISKQLLKSYNLGQINEKDFDFRQGSYSFKNGSDRGKYVDIWFKAIMNQREAIYTYILGFYRYLLNPSKYPFPYFTVS